MTTSSRLLNNSSQPSPEVWGGDGKTTDLSTWAGAYVKIEATVNGVHVTVEGEVVKAKAALLLLDRGKGKNQMMLELAEIRTMEEIPRPVPVMKLTVRNLASVDESTVRQHLADRHGFPLAGINPIPALALADHLNAHRREGLGHVHDSSRGTTQDSRPSPDEIAARALTLDIKYSQALECRSCGYIRLPDEDGRIMHRLKDDDEDGPAHHCDDCADHDEYTYI
jgi:hypothetical protein